MAVSSIIVLALLLLRLAILCVPLYVLLLAARALRKYLSEPPKGGSMGGTAPGGMASQEGDRRRFWPLGPVSIAVLAVVALIFIGLGLDWWGGGAHAVSIIGGADGPTSVFVAGKLGGMHGMHGFLGLMAVVRLGFLAVAAYLICLIIRALRKYLGQ